MHIKPKAGRRLLIPGQGRRAMPEQGMEVDDFDLHWTRCVSVGDAEVVDKAEPASTDTPPAEDAPAAAIVKSE